MNAGTLTAFLKLDRSDYSSGIDTSKKQAQELEKSLSKMEKNSSSSFSNLATAAVAAGAAIAGAVAAAGLSKLVDVTREFDVLNAGLITITGSTEKAAVAFDAINAFASSTPYSISQVTEAFTKLANYGLTPSEAALTSYGNTAAAMGKSLEQMIEAVADAASGEFERLKEFGIKSKKEGDNVSFTFQGTTTTIKNSAAEIEKYLMGLGNINFAGAMEQRMDSLDGMISNLGDQWDALFRNISSNGVGEVMQASVGLGITALEELNATIASGELAAQLQAGISLWSSWGEAIVSSITYVRTMFTTEASAISDYWSKTIEWMVDAFVFFPQNIQALIGTVVVAVSSSFDKMGVYAKGFKEQLANMFDVDASTAARDQMFASIAAINTAREESYDSILKERQAAIESYNSQQTAAEGLRKGYDDAAEAARKNHTDQLAQFAVQKAGLDATGDATDENGKKAKKSGQAYLSLSQQIDIATEAGVNFGSQLAMIEKMKGIDVQSDRVKNLVKETNTLIDKAKDLGEAYSTIYEELGESSSAYAELSLKSQLNSIDKQIAGYKQLGVDEDTLRALRAKKEKELYEDWALAHGDFIDGFIVGMQEAADSITTMGELGKETFDTLYSSWKDGFYAVITADWEGLSSVWDSLLSSLLRQFSDFVAGLLLEWAAAEFLNINIGVNSTSLTSGSSSSIISGISSLFSSDVGGGPGALSNGGTAGGEVASLAAAEAASLAADSWTSTFSTGMQTALSYAGMGMGAYGMYSGISNISEGNYGVGALQTGLGAYSAYQGAVGADLLASGTATDIATSMGNAMSSYFSGSGGATIATEVGTAVAKGTSAYQIGQTAYTAGQGATSYSTFQTAAGSGAGGAAGGAMAGLGAVGAFMALVYSLNNVGGETPTISPTDSMNTMGMTPEDLSAITNSWSIVTDTVLDLDDSLSQFGVGMQTIGEVTYNANESMLYYTTGMGVMASSFDEATQTWSEAAVGMHLDAQQLGASATAASSQTIAAASSIISSYTGTSTTMFDAATVANHAANAYQDLATSESGSTTYAIELQWALQDMGLTASQAASAADELIAQMEAETEAQNGVSDSASTATSSLMGFGTIITETATATADSMSTLVSSLGGFASSASSTADSLRKAVGSWDEAVSSEGSRSATSEHAAGGIFTQPARIGRHIFGEQGMEALLPLPDGPNTLSNMSKAITRLEQNQGSSYSGPSTIQVNLIAEGKTLAKVIMPFVDQQVTAQSRRGVLSDRTSY